MKRRERGFTLIEALVTLVVSSVLFAALFEISSRAADRAAMLGARAQALGEAALDERMFRMLLGRMTPPLQRAGGVPPIATFSGDRLTIVGQTSSDAEAACMGSRPYAPLRLEIRQQGGEGALFCIGDAGEQTLARWTGGEASFAYSIDGLDWFERWPNAEQQSLISFVERGEENEDPLAQRVRFMMPAPLVRLSMPGRGGARVWIERAGSTELQPLPRREFLFTTETAPPGAFEVIIP